METPSEREARDEARLYELAWSIVVRTSELLGEPVPDIEHDDGLHPLAVKSRRTA